MCVCACVRACVCVLLAHRRAPLHSGLVCAGRCFHLRACPCVFCGFVRQCPEPWGKFFLCNFSLRNSVLQTCFWMTESNFCVCIFAFGLLLGGAGATSTSLGQGQKICDFGGDFIFAKEMQLKNCFAFFSFGVRQHFVLGINDFCKQLILAQYALRQSRLRPTQWRGEGEGLSATCWRHCRGPGHTGTGPPGPKLQTVCNNHENHGPPLPCGCIVRQNQAACKWRRCRPVPQCRFPERKAFEQNLRHDPVAQSLDLHHIPQGM